MLHIAVLWNKAIYSDSADVSEDPVASIVYLESAAWFVKCQTTRRCIPDSYFRDKIKFHNKIHDTKTNVIAYISISFHQWVRETGKVVVFSYVISKVTMSSG